jgi:hypothetical protein
MNAKRSAILVLLIVAIPLVVKPMNLGKNKNSHDLAIANKQRNLSTDPNARAKENERIRRNTKLHESFLTWTCCCLLCMKE